MIQQPVKPNPDRPQCAECGSRVGPFERRDGVIRCMSWFYCLRNRSQSEVPQ